MAEPTTPGECAYAAYHQGAPLPWALLPAYERQNWEAAAQAVLALGPPAGADDQTAAASLPVQGEVKAALLPTSSNSQCGTAAENLA